jgi:hypothetical protein
MRTPQAQAKFIMTSKSLRIQKVTQIRRHLEYARRRGADARAGGHVRVERFSARLRVIRVFRAEEIRVGEMRRPSPGGVLRFVRFVRVVEAIEIVQVIWGVHGRSATQKFQRLYGSALCDCTHAIAEIGKAKGWAWRYGSTQGKNREGMTLIRDQQCV